MEDRIDASFCSFCLYEHSVLVDPERCVEARKLRTAETHTPEEMKLIFG